MGVIPRSTARARRVERLTWRRGSFWLLHDEASPPWRLGPTPDPWGWEPGGDPTRRERIARLDETIGAFALASPQTIWRFLHRAAVARVPVASLRGALLVDRMPVVATLRRPDPVPRGLLAVCIDVPAGTRVAPIGAMSAHPTVDPADVLLPRDVVLRIDQAGEHLGARLVTGSVAGRGGGAAGSRTDPAPPPPG